MEKCRFGVQKGVIVCVCFYRQEEGFIDENFPGTRWIGLNDIDEEGTFVWANGDPVDYQVSTRVGSD